ncbi:MAG: hypothetical protein ACYDBY_02590 [Thermoanaerobaculia bacterium]
MSRLLRLPLVLALFATAGCGGASATSTFATRAEAGAAVAPWVPGGATDLRLATEEGSDAFWLRFRLPVAERQALEPGLVRIPDTQVATLTFRAPKGVDWWFRGLVQVVPARETSVVAADVHSGNGTAVPLGTFVAFDRASDLVYAWKAGR